MQIYNNKYCKVTMFAYYRNMKNVAQIFSHLPLSSERERACLIKAEGRKLAPHFSYYGNT